MRDRKKIDQVYTKDTGTQKKLQKNQTYTVQAEKKARLQFILFLYLKNILFLKLCFSY